MMYFKLIAFANNAVGAEFCYCKESELEDTKLLFNPDTTEQISKEEYEEGIKRQKIRFLRFATGFPK